MAGRSRRSPSSPLPSVALVTLGCARNEVDSEELAGRLEGEGWRVAADPGAADVVLVNTCGFVETAKKDSIDLLLSASDHREAGRAKAVVAVGCLAERYGAELATALPEADAVLSFDDYPHIAERLRAVVAGDPHDPHVPRDRRRLLPISPAARGAGGHAVPGHASPQPGPEVSRPVDLPEGLAPASGPRPLRRRLGDGPVAPLKLASGCDRRCSFCAIPSFRGAYLSRPPEELLAEARWLAGQGVREIVLVSENSTCYGKDLGDVRLLERMLPDLAAVDGIGRVRVSYLQPAEMRPSLVEVLASTPGVAPYFDLSFQHASAPVLRRMRRFGDTARFLDLLRAIRDTRPEAGVRSNFIVGFPGETNDDVDELESFLADAGLDAVGVFGYSDEDGTEAAGFAGKHDDDTIRARVGRIGRLVEELIAERARERVGETVEVLVENVPDHPVTDSAGDDPVDGPLDRAIVEGRAAHQAPEVDGVTTVRFGSARPDVGEIVRAKVVAAEGPDLVAELIEVLD